MVQFATAERAWLLQVNNPASREAIAALLQHGNGESGLWPEV